MTTEEMQALQVGDIVELDGQEEYMVVGFIDDGTKRIPVTIEIQRAMTPHRWKLIGSRSASAPRLF